MKVAAFLRCCSLLRVIALAKKPSFPDLRQVAPERAADLSQGPSLVFTSRPPFLSLIGEAPERKYLRAAQGAARAEHHASSRSRNGVSESTLASKYQKGPDVGAPCSQSSVSSECSAAVLENFGLKDAPVKLLCLPEKRSYVASFFRKSFELIWSARMTEVFSRMNGPVMLTIGESRNIPLLYNFFAYAENMTEVDQEAVTIVHVGLDLGASSACENISASLVPLSLLQIVCIDLAGWLPAELFPLPAEVNHAYPPLTGNVGFGTCAFNYIVWAKPLLLLAAVQASSHGVLLIDSDVLLYHNLLRYITTHMGKKFPGFLVTGLDGSTDYANTGTVYATRSASPVIEQWVEEQKKELNRDFVDQRAFRNLLLRVPQIRKDIWESLPPSVVVQKSGERDASRGEYATHYTYQPEKIRTMRTRNEWTTVADDVLRGIRDQKARNLDVMNGICPPERRNATVDIFLKTFEQHWSARVKEVFSAMNDSAMMTISERTNSPLLWNFLAFAETMTASEKETAIVANVALDADSFRSCEDFRSNQSSASLLQVRCVDLAGWLPSELFVIPSEFDPHQTGELGNLGYGTCAFDYVVWTKPVVFLAAVQANAKGVLMIDTDVLLERNLLGYIKTHMGRKPGGVLISGRDGLHSANVNTGTVFSNRSSEDLIKRWIELQKPELNGTYVDQHSLQRLLLDENIRDNVWESFPQAIVGQCGLKGKYATHYTCEPAKIHKMRSQKQWSSIAEAALRRSYVS